MNYIKTIQDFEVKPGTEKWKRCPICRSDKVLRDKRFENAYKCINKHEWREIGEREESSQA